MAWSDLFVKKNGAGSADDTQTLFGKGLQMYQDLTLNPFSGNFAQNKQAAMDKERLDAIKKAQAESLNSPYNVASVTPEVQQAHDLWAKELAQQQIEAKYGLSDAEKAEAMQNYTGAVNLNYQNAINQSGGQFAPYLNAVMNTGANKFATSLAAQDAAIKRQKQSIVAQYLGGLTNAAQSYQDVFNQNFNKQLLTEQALGQAAQDAYYNQRQDAIAAEQARQARNNQILSLFTYGAANGMGGNSAPSMSRKQLLKDLKPSPVTPTASDMNNVFDLPE